MLDEQRVIESYKYSFDECIKMYKVDRRRFAEIINYHDDRINWKIFEDYATSLNPHGIYTHPQFLYNYRDYIRSFKFIIPLATIEFINCKIKDGIEDPRFKGNLNYTWRPGMKVEPHHFHMRSEWLKVLDKMASIIETEEEQFEFNKLLEYLNPTTPTK